VGVFIYFIHHIPENINMSNVIGKVGEALNMKVDSLYPTNIGKDGPIIELELNLKKHETIISATKHGYIRILDGNFLLKIACKNNIIINIVARPGDYITEEDTLLRIYSSEKPADGIKKNVLALLSMAMSVIPNKIFFFCLMK
jgi:uncharacterized membrane protein